MTSPLPVWTWLTKGDVAYAMRCAELDEFDEALREWQAAHGIERDYWRARAMLAVAKEKKRRDA